MEDLKKACKELNMWLSKSLIWASGAKKCYRINRKIPFAKSPKKNYFLDPKKKKKFCSWIPKEGYFLLTPQRKGLDINLHSRADACTGWKSANRTATKKAFFSTLIHHQKLFSRDFDFSNDFDISALKCTRVGLTWSMWPKKAIHWWSF